MNVPAVNFQIDPCHNEWPKEREADRRECDKFMQEEQWQQASSEYHVIRALYEGATTLTEITKASGKGKTTAHRALKRLIECRLVRRYRGYITKKDGKVQEVDKFRWIG